MHSSAVSLLTVSDDQLLIRSLSSAIICVQLYPLLMEKPGCLMSLWADGWCFQQSLLLLFLNFDFTFEEADSCHYNQVVREMKTHSSLLSVLSMESNIDRCGDVEGIELQEAGGVGGCPWSSGFISQVDCQRPSDSAGNQ